MSEQLKPRVESSAGESLKPVESREIAYQQAETSPEQNQRLDVEKLKENVEKHATARQEAAPPDKTPETNQSLGIAKELKAESFSHTMSKVRRQLPALDRNFSKFIHKPAVERVSEAGSKTLARPSGILGGGTVMFLGSLLALYFAKSYGFKYNYLLFAILFVGGYFGGLFIELLWLVFRRRDS